MKYLTVRQVAEQLGKSEETIKRWLRAGRFPNASKVSDKEGWKIPMSDINGQAYHLSDEVQVELELHPKTEDRIHKQWELIELAYLAVTLTYPPDELVPLLRKHGLKRTLETLLVMRQSPKKVLNPVGFLKRALTENWTPSTIPRQVNRRRERIEQFFEKSQQAPALPHFPLYNWLEVEDD